MKSFQNKKFDKLTIIGFVVSLVIIISYAIWYYSVIAKQVDEAARREMYEIGLQLELVLENIIDENVDDLDLLAEYASRVDGTDESIQQFLASQSHVEEFDNLFYIGLDGIGISKNNRKHDFSDNVAFLSALQRDYFISDPHFLPNSGSFVFDTAVPVKKDGKIVAVMYSESSMEDFNEAMDSLTRGSGIAFLLDKKMNVVFANKSTGIESTVLFKKDADLLGLEDVKKAKEDILKGQSGSFIYEANGLPRALVYTPVNMTDWVLVVSIEMGAINTQLNIAVGHISSISVIILFILFALIFYTWYSRTSLLRSAEKNAYFDPLTGLPNLLKLKKDMHTILSEKTNSVYSILKFDIVNFKTVNEMFGFKIGNHVLKASIDIQDVADEPTLIVSRIGVDEFILFSDSNFLEDIEAKKSIFESLYNKRIPDLSAHKLTFKYGRYRIEPGETDVDNIVNKVNLAHTIAKSNKDEIVYDYNDLFKKQMLREAELTGKMEFALKNNEFQVYLQPKYDIVTETLAGAEALVRWIGTDGKIIFPNEFIPLFEKNGFIVQIDRHVLEIACQCIRKWLDQGIESIAISVNFSRMNLINPNFVEDIVRIVDSYNVPHECIDIELTESTMLENEENTEKLLNDLHLLGFRISIDDFGSGYSSLGLLKNLKADTLKLDKSFFNDTKDIDRSNKVVGGIIRLAHGLNMCVVAEGIENLEQIETLRVVRCNVVQGFYYARPMPIAEFEDKYIFVK